VAIEGEFQVVEPPTRLVYTWRMGDEGELSRVTVRFEARDGGTEVIVTHEQLPRDDVVASHGAGWSGCLDGLARYATRTDG
jgi:uncharacterized protein YndB with AHSA1/START domain